MKTHYIEDLAEGMEAHYERTVTEADIVAFAQVSGDTNPVHLDEEYAKGTMFKGRIAHGMLSAAYISTVLGTRLPGPGCIYMSQTLKFLAPVRIGDTVSTTLRLTTLDTVKRRAQFHCQCSVGDKKVVEGEALVLVPSRG